MFKKSTVFILHFTPACVLLSVCSLQSAFYTQSAFYPWSAVCSPQFAFYTDPLFCLLNYNNRELKNHDEVPDADVCSLGNDRNGNVSFDGKKET